MRKSTKYLNINKNKSGILLKKDLPNESGIREYVSNYLNATVADVCLNSDSTLYRSNKDLGIIVFSMDNDQDFYGIAFPNFSSLREYPVIGEKVRIFSYEYVLKENEEVLLANRFYYDVVPIENGVTSDESYTEINQNITLKDKFVKACGRIIKKVLYTEIGEKTIESRFNSVIKLGYKIGNDSNKTLSELKIINNNRDSKESFIDDGSSIYLTSGEDFSLESSVIDETIYNPPDNNKNIVAIKSDKIIVNSRNEVDLICDKKFNVFANKSNIVCDKLDIDSKGINLGGNGSNNNAVLFNELNEILTNMIDAISKLTVVVPSAGTSSVPVNVSEFFNIKMKLNGMKSKIVKIKE